MVRPLRIEFEGAVYHVTARGNERRQIFKDKADYRWFVGLLAHLPERFGALIHGYALMGNHYHLLIETPRPNLSRAMHYVNASYAGRFNRKRKRAGHLLQGRYRGLLIEKDSHLLSVSRYIHLNPVRAGVCERPEQYVWSSYLEYIGRVKRSGWLTCEWVLEQFASEPAQARRRYKRFVEDGLGLNENPFEGLRNGFVLGSEKFLAEAIKKAGVRRHREVPQSRGLADPPDFDVLIALVAERFGVSERDILQRGTRNNAARNACLYLLRNLTESSNEEISQHFGVGPYAVSKAALRFKEELARDRTAGKLVADLTRMLMSNVKT